jgi:hypothetical protein
MAKDVVKIEPEQQQSMLIKPAGTIQEAAEQFQLYQQLKEKLATKDDFQPIRGKKHPKKSFVRKVQRFFNLSCEIIRDEPLKDEGKIIAWVATARATHLQTGSFQDADGSCSFDEKNEKQRTIHNIRAHAITRAKNRAILDLVGFGDVSAEEVNHDGEYEQPDTVYKNNGHQRRTSNKNANKAFFAKLNDFADDRGYDHDFVKEKAKEALRDAYRIDSCSKLQPAEWEKIVKNFDRFLATLEEKYLNVTDISEEDIEAIADEIDLPDDSEVLQSE